MKPLRLLGAMLLALLAALGLLSIVEIALLGLFAPAHMMAGGGRSPMTWAFPGAAFQPAVSRADGSGWRLTYILVDKQTTIVVALVSPRQVIMSLSRPTVYLTDSSGHSYQQQQLPSSPVFPPRRPADSSTI